MKNPPLLSIVVPVYNEEAVLLQCYRRLAEVSSDLDAEILFVDDGSRDHSAAILDGLAQRDPRVKVLLLTRNFGHQAAVTAGLHHACGQAVVVIDADLQDPPELITEFLRRWQQGYDVVYGIRTVRSGESWFKRASAHWFYRILRRLSDVDIPLDVGDFRLLSRPVVDVINAMPEHHRFLRGMAAWTGFRQTGVPYVRQPRAAGHSKYPWRRMWRLSVDALTGFTVAPLRIGTRLALLVAVIAAIFSVWLIVQKMTHPANLVLGWTSLMVTVLWLGALQLGVIGMVGEYVGRIAEEARGRPLYVIGRTVNLEPAESIPPGRRSMPGSGR